MRPPSGKGRRVGRATDASPRSVRDPRFTVLPARGSAHRPQPVRAKACRTVHAPGVWTQKSDHVRTLPIDTGMTSLTSTEEERKRDITDYRPLVRGRSLRDMHVNA